MVKKREPFSTSIDGTLKKKLNELAEHTEINVSKLTDKAIELLLDYYNENEKTPHRNPINTRSNTNNKEKPIKIDNKEPDIEINDILNIDLNQVQDALNTIKSFQIKFNPDLIEKAKSMKLNEFKGEFKKHLDKYVINQIKDSKIYDAIPPVTIFQSRDEDLDVLNELIEEVASEQIANPQIDTKNK